MPDDRFLEPEIETMPRASIEALQEERILELVPYVYERSPLIRKTWEEAKVKPSDINSLADFTERAPFITKDDVRRFRDEAGDPFGGLLCTRYADATTELEHEAPILELDASGALRAIRFNTRSAQPLDCRAIVGSEVRDRSCPVHRHRRLLEVAHQ